ncbi:hypothetical protein GF345_02775 [Candidatus Woesearchaeota archaeon]|nr:hypothetical protein [Candidatus Woesearchaeota archaeon]
MAKAKKKEESLGSEIKDAIKDAFAANVLVQAKEYMKDLAHRAQEVAYHTEQKILENLFAGIILFVGSVMIIMAVVYFINDYFLLDRYWGFLIVGLVLVVIALFYKRKIERTRYYDFERPKR